MIELTKTLQGIVGEQYVRLGEHARSHSVDGMAPHAVVLPGSVEEASEVLAACSKAGAVVVPWGGGTSMGLGGIPPRVDVVLALARLNAVIDHEPGDMTSTVQAGMALNEYQAQLGIHGQFLPLEAPASTRATIGGILAANVSGPRRLRYGTARDLLIGVRVVHADGTVTKGGAKVVKNVTGYDMNKVYVGSLGTLGVIVEATFRLHPLPPVERTWIASFPTAAKARDAVNRIMGSPLAPSAVELLNGAAAAAVSRRAGIPLEAGAVFLAVAVGSVHEAVRAQLEAVGRMGEEAGCRNDQLLEGQAHNRFWTGVLDFDAGEAPATVLKASVLLSKVGEAVSVGERVAAEKRLSAAIISEAGTGIVRYFLRADGAEPDSSTRLCEAVGALRAFATESRGGLVVLDAPPELKALVDVWGPVGDGLALMQGLKEQFDPGRILNPGRFVGGL